MPLERIEIFLGKKVCWKISHSLNEKLKCTGKITFRRYFITMKTIQTKTLLIGKIVELPITIGVFFTVYVTLSSAPFFWYKRNRRREFVYIIAIIPFVCTPLLFCSSNLFSDILFKVFSWVILLCLLPISPFLVMPFFSPLVVFMPLFIQNFKCFFSLDIFSFWYRK